MEVKFDLKRKYIVNGREYTSIEQMPADIRQVYEKAVSGKEGISNENILSLSAGKIVFNGQEYESVDSMPLDIRQMYEKIMKSVGEGKVAVSGKAGINKDGTSVSFQKGGVLNAYTMSKPITPGSFFSPRLLIVGAAVIILLIGIYVLVIMGSR
ncbi:MAG: hypothetical protein KBG22_07510 [Smithella sp.]|nr:hypothetical protein [Smithella sp.]HOU50821.1 hypothetical protein [Smithella sp.]HQG64848.1 hypothetical protein [Smithella sp.]HQH17826.1 hypothetical protein [Smithella sp.]HQI72998.1 hypothetical protein [Smithella sp.]